MRYCRNAMFIMRRWPFGRIGESELDRRRLILATPSISVVMSAYNAECYLREAVASVLAQTYTDFEFIIINDGSTDRTGEILASFSDPRIRLLEQENKGLAVALNRGLREARAPLIARMDADDTCRPDRLEREIAVLRSLPEVDMVTARVQHMDADGHLLESSHPPRFPDELELDPVDGLLETYRFRGNVLAAMLDVNLMSHPTILGKRRVFIENGEYDETFHRAQDYDLWLRLVSSGCQFAYIDEPLCFYRTHKAQNPRTARDILNSDYDIAAIQKLVDADDISSDIRMLARRALAARHTKQAWRCQACGRWREARRHHAAALRNCPNAEHLIRYTFHALRLDSIRLLKRLRRLKPRDSSNNQLE